MVPPEKESKSQKMLEKQKHKTSRIAQLLVLAGVLVFAFAVLALKNEFKAEIPVNSGQPPMMQLDAALNAGRPTLAFFHSNTCEQCIIMVETVGQVFPEFVKTITLVDINVYDPINEPLLDKVGLQYIPTLIFYDNQGQEETYVGVMTAGELRERLATLAGAQ